MTEQQDLEIEACQAVVKYAAGLPQMHIVVHNDKVKFRLSGNWFWLQEMCELLESLRSGYLEATLQL